MKSVLQKTTKNVPLQYKRVLKNYNSQKCKAIKNFFFLKKALTFEEKSTMNSKI